MIEIARRDSFTAERQQTNLSILKVYILKIVIFLKYADILKVNVDFKNTGFIIILNIGGLPPNPPLFLFFFLETDNIPIIEPIALYGCYPVIYS